LSQIQAAAVQSTTAQQRTPLPDFADIMFVLVILLLTALLPNFLLTDGSTGWHLYTGQYILSHWQIPHQDLFSYTFPTKNWIPYEWLFDVTAASLLKAGGIKLVAVVTACTLAGLFAGLYHACRREGCHFYLSMVFTGLAILTSTIHWLARPHIFTFFGVFFFARTLEEFRRGNCSPRRLILALSLIMLIWVNMHPAFLIGFGLIVIYLACETFIGLFSGESDIRTAAFQRARSIGLALIATVAASFINPNGIQLYAYIAQYLHGTTVLSQTNEYMQPSFKQLHAITMALLFFAFVIGLVISNRRIGLSPLMVVLAFAWLAVNSMRNEPLFVLASTPIIAFLYADCDLGLLLGKAHMQPARWWKAIAALWHRFGETVDSMESSCDMHIVPIAMSLVLIASCFFGGKLLGIELVSSGFDPASKPTTTLDAMSKYPEGSGFNLDNWGGYITYKTGRRVFIDDRLDFYGEKFYLDYGAIINLGANWKQLLDKYKINWVLMPKASPLVQALKDSPDWKLDAEDKAAALVVRKQPL
jgi:hypothetical protein